MIALLWILMVAATSVFTIVDEVFEIPANKWNYTPCERQIGNQFVSLKQKPAVVHAQFQVESGPKQVRLALLRSEDLERLRAELPHGVIDETPLGGSGALTPHVHEPGDYVVVVDNQGDAPAKVRLVISLDFAVGPDHEVTQLSRPRQFVVILLSFGVFFGIVTWSARRLLRGIRR